MTRHFGLANIVWSPLEGGWLTGKYRRGQGNPEDTKRAEKWIGDLDNPKFRRRLDAVEKLIPLAEAKGVPPAEMALAWTLENPAVTSTILGPRTMEQLESCLKSLEVDFTDEDHAAIDEIVAPGTTVL